MERKEINSEYDARYACSVLYDYHDFEKLFLGFFFACQDFLDDFAPTPLSKTMPRACFSPEFKVGRPLLAVYVA